MLMARGRDAADVPISNTFGPNTLQSFKVWTDEEPVQTSGDSRPAVAILSLGRPCRRCGGPDGWPRLAGLLPLRNCLLRLLDFAVRSLLTFGHQQCPFVPATRRIISWSQAERRYFRPHDVMPAQRHHFNWDDTCRCGEISSRTAKRTSNDNSCLVKARSLGGVLGWCDRNGRSSASRNSGGTSGTAEKLAQERADTAVVAALVPVLRREGSAGSRQGRVRQTTGRDVILLAQRHGDEGRLGDLGQ